MNKIIVSGAVFILLAISVSAFSESLSDLDLGSFERHAAPPEVKGTVSPFEGGGGGGGAGGASVGPGGGKASSAEDLTIDDLEISGIVYRDEYESYALISGYMVRPGDKIAGYRVDKINPDRVRLRRLDEVVVLEIGGGI